MWTVPPHSTLGGIVGIHYLSQVSWPVGLFVLSQLPDHSHYGLVWPLHQPISLGVVRHGSYSCHAEDLAQFINDAAHKASTVITKEPGWGPKDQDVTLIQELGDGFSCLIRCHICQYMLCKMVLEHQDVGDSMQFVQLHCCLYAGKIFVQEVQWSGGHYWM